MKPNSESAAATGNTSATVIQSMPSIKLTRFTNQMPLISMRVRSSHQGNCDTMRSPEGNVAITMATATACSKSRGKASSGRMSSVTPTAASPIVHAKMRVICGDSAGDLVQAKPRPQRRQSSPQQPRCRRLAVSVHGGSCGRSVGLMHSVE